MASKQQHQWQAIVVGQQEDELLRQAIAWLKEDHWIIKQATHVYAVAVLLGEANSNQILVLGQPNALVQRYGELLRLLVNTGTLTCGLISGKNLNPMDWVYVEKVQAYGSPVFMQQEAFLTWLKPKVDLEAMLLKGSQADFWGKQYRTTEAELAALLDQDGTHGGTINAIN